MWNSSAESRRQCRREGKEPLAECALGGPALLHAITPPQLKGITMHKLVAGLTALVMLPLALAGCGSSGDTTGTKGGATSQAQTQTKAPA